MMMKKRRKKKNMTKSRDLRTILIKNQEENTNLKRNLRSVPHNGCNRSLNLSSLVCYRTLKMTLQRRHPLRPHQLQLQLPYQHSRSLRLLKGKNPMMQVVMSGNPKGLKLISTIWRKSQKKMMWSSMRRRQTKQRETRLATRTVTFRLTMLTKSTKTRTMRCPAPLSQRKPSLNQRIYPMWCLTVWRSMSLRRLSLRKSMRLKKPMSPKKPISLLKN